MMITAHDIANLNKEIETIKRETNVSSALKV